MNLISCEKLEKSMVELQFSIDAETFKSAVNAAFKREGAVLFLRLIQLLAEHKQPGEAVTGAVEQIRLFIDCHLTENLRTTIAAYVSCDRKGRKSPPRSC